MQNQPSRDASQVEAPEKTQTTGYPPEPPSREVALPRKPSWRTHLALGFVVVAALFSLVQSVRYFQPQLFIGLFQHKTALPSDFIARNERLLGCISSELPSAEVVGFMSDLEGPAHQERYRITQYVLAPTLVDDSIDHTYIIGVFSAPYDPAPPDPEQFLPIVNCGTGIFLLQNKEIP